MKIVSKFFIGLGCIICFFLLFIIIFVFLDGVSSKENIEVLCFSIPLLIIFIYSIFSYYIKLQENSLILKVLGITREIKYNDIKQIVPAYQPGCYWINTEKNEMIFFVMPLAHTSLTYLFKVILENNPEVIINVKWFNKR